MVDVTGKLFVDFSSGEKKLKKIDWDKNSDYYSFVRENNKKGLHQVILTSEIMMQLARYYFLERSLSVEAIEFIEEDSELLENIAFLLNHIKGDRGYWGELTKEINFLEENSSIDLKKITVSGREEQGAPVRIYFQVNGLFAITAPLYESESMKLMAIVEKYI